MDPGGPRAISVRYVDQLSVNQFLVVVILDTKTALALLLNLSDNSQNTLNLMP
jgi:hypothetical protein